MKIGIGVNEYVVLGATEGLNHSLQSHGLSGCVLLIITDSLQCYFAHVSRKSSGEQYYLEQMAGLEQSIKGVEFHRPTITIIGQRTPFGWSPNMLRLKALAERVCPGSQVQLVADKGASVSFRRASLSWEILDDNHSDYSGNHNTLDAGGQGITCGFLTPVSDVCRSGSVTES